MRHETGLIDKWYDIGLELLDNDTTALNVIKKNNPNDIEECCTEMFKKWLESNPKANWDKLIVALTTIGMDTAADNIIKGMYITCTDYTVYAQLLNA